MPRSSWARRTRDTARITRTYTIANGTPYAHRTRTLRYNIGTCSGASVSLPHNRGELPRECDACWAVTDGA